MDDNLIFLDKLETLRSSIDKLDDQIINMLNVRAKLALDVGKLKQSISENKSVLHPDREAKIIERLKKKNHGPFPRTAVSSVWTEIISACRSLEQSITVAYLGPKGSFSEQAAIEHFGHSVKLLVCSSIDEVFRVVETESANVGMVPVENSTEGSINRSLDLLFSTSLKIIGERSLAISHCLMTQTGSMVNITHIFAHPQALAQCQLWIKSHYPNLPLMTVSSNSEAARIALENKNIAAIAGEMAANVWNLKIVANSIQDEGNNRTRFVSIGKINTCFSGRDKSSLILAVPNKAGAVCKMLEPFTKHKVSMTKFESRPAKTEQWEYYFYIDIQGHKDEIHISKALKELQSKVVFFKLLGSYPISY
ncbi:MAG: prephenate dehydratase [Bordetella sp.]|nr:MAG: prephenate dehydratase [Bordetella sp.]